MNSVAQLLERAAETYPARIAIEDEKECVSYQTLRERSRRMASSLLHRGAERTRPIAVYLPKSARCVVCFYGALYCGVPYAPLDYLAPPARTAATLQNLQPSCIITDAQGRETLRQLDFAAERIVDYDTLLASETDERAVDDALRNVIDTDPAYIMYTSGSTGTPKGVVIAQRGVTDYAAWIADTFSITEETVCGLQSGFHFDNSVFDLYATALRGGKVQIIPDALFMYPIKLMEYVSQKRVSCIFWVPTVMIQTAECGVLGSVDLSALKTVVFAGEVMPNRQLNIWRRALPDALFANLYGPTEITVDCTCYIVDREFADDEDLPIGRDRENMRILLLGENNMPVKKGKAGELCVVGSQLALGYWNNPEQTAKAFVPNPLNSAWEETMYRTGDLAYRDAEGLIHYVGRKDSQIKLRGNRIELGDIEAAARNLEGVTNACALYDKEAEEILLFLETKEAVSSRKFIMRLNRLLPHYMVPKKIRTMEEFPLNANRKIDRRALRELAAGENQIKEG